MGELAYYKSILSALKVAGYKGTMSIEAPAEDLLRQGAETLNMLRLAEG
jgi:sugar phosphate isomerase/epimerase